MTIEEMLKETGTKCEAPMEHKEDAPKHWKCPVRARLAEFIRLYESKQRIFKKNNLHKEAYNNAKNLTQLYAFVNFLKDGKERRMLCSSLEELFNDFFADHRNFRNMYWELWNKKFSKTNRCIYCGKFIRKGEKYCEMHQP